jgi:CBS domain-containing protein
VLDGNGNLTGIFTKTDLTEVYSKYYESGNLVEDYMTAKVFTVVPSHSIHTVLATMVRNKISRIVVVRGQKPVGIVTTRDLLPISRLIEAEIVGMPSEVAMARRQTTPVFSGLSHVLLARDVMTRDPITVTGDSGLADAAHLMVNNGISGFPVVDSDDNLIGIVTKTDVVRALAAN